MGMRWAACGTVAGTVLRDVSHNDALPLNVPGPLPATPTPTGGPLFHM